jgi:hypothetical protein
MGGRVFPFCIHGLLVRSAALRVPNAVVPLETNYLVDPTRADYRLVEIEGQIDYVVDDRLV